VVGKSAARQEAIRVRQGELIYRAGLLIKPDGKPGSEGERRLKKAMLESVAQRKAGAAQVAEHREVEAMARQIARDERVKSKAQALAGRFRDTR
jgi:hypothetical protein